MGGALCCFFRSFMLILLPPSETKRAGGARGPVDLATLTLPGLLPERERMTDALIALAGDAAASARVLKLGPKQHGDATVNAALRSGPVMPAIDRYTGVLFDALDAPSLDAAARAWLGRNVMVHSAAFGPVGAMDRIPAYRLGAGITVPGVPPVRRLWADAVTRELVREEAGFVLDLRSESYVALGPVPADVASAYVRVTSEGADGVVRALNHFNKQAKGQLVRTLATARPRVRSRAALLRWAQEAGIPLFDRADSDEMELRV